MDDESDDDEGEGWQEVVSACRRDGAAMLTVRQKEKGFASEKNCVLLIPDTRFD